MPIRLAIVLIILLFSLQLRSQVRQDDVVYLNNGTFLRGNIVEIVPESLLKIVLSGKDTLEIRMNEVKIIRKENPPKDTDPNYEDGIKSWGYTIIPELNIGVGLLEGLDRYLDAPQKKYSIQLSVFNGLTLTPYIQLGISIGLDLWKSRAFLPICLDLRANFLKKVNSPFIYCHAGYSPGWQVGERGMGLGGATAGYGAGAKFRFSRKLIMVVSMGYRFQQTRLWQVNHGVTSKATIDAHMVNFRTGFIF